MLLNAANPSSSLVPASPPSGPSSVAHRSGSRGAARPRWTSPTRAHRASRRVLVVVSHHREQANHHGDWICHEEDHPPWPTPCLPHRQIRHPEAPPTNGRWMQGVDDNEHPSGAQSCH